MTDRPFIFCHMLTSLDGKIIGNYMSIPEASTAGDVFYALAFGENPHYRHQGWLSGRVTTDDNFTRYRHPALDEHAAPVPEGDFVAVQDAEKYYVSIDPSGRLGWESPDLTYRTTHAHVLEVLTGRASNAYKAFLRKLGISYVIAGEEELDRDLLLAKLKELFGIETLMLGGGGVLNWSFVHAGLCDEISVVIAPAADGASDSPALFETGGRTPDGPRGFTLQSAEVREGGSVWLRYSIDHEKESA
ncbi:RibD family protein [Gulosibacter sp. 10]|uniref:RibD family protein n=1 Tax=Gulosibacter sp. 10 TaxID=1255570 RepID=UPI00097E8C54|nr:RibD family protein [Gulosibacter sp. 10]SJM70064.1 Pyrimidine reductase, riboflavin biosynthesis [Gulosibacter sp. 10]